MIGDAVKRAGNRKKLAGILGVSHPTVGEWADGVTLPKTESLVAIIKYLGGDIKKAFDDPPPGAPLEILGSVSAGAVRLTDTESQTVDDPAQVFEKSRYWARGFGPVKYLRVDGDSMEPDFPKDSLVAVRRTNVRPQSFEVLTPVVFKHVDTGEYTFKLIQVAFKERSKEVDRIMGIPLNRTHVVANFVPEHVVVEFVVVGQIQVASPAYGPSTKNPQLLLFKEGGDNGHEEN